jgi:hypothetical protein
MKYIKPQIVTVSDAIDSIHSSVANKGNQQMLDSHTLQNNATIGAYEADE